MDKKASEFGRRKNRNFALDSYCNICRNIISVEYQRTIDGLLSRLYARQRSSSRSRGHKMPAYSKIELKEWLFSKTNFIVMFNKWKKSDHDKWLIPSVDRLNDRKGYSIDNIQLVTWRENNISGYLENHKNNERKVIQYSMVKKKINIFISVTTASKMLNIHQGNISSNCKGTRKSAGGFIWEYEDGD